MKNKKLLIGIIVFATLNLLVAFYFLFKSNEDLKNLIKNSQIYDGVVVKVENGAGLKLKNCVKITYKWKQNNKIFSSATALPTDTTYNKWLSQSRWKEIGRPKERDSIKVYVSESGSSFLYPSFTWKN